MRALRYFPQEVLCNLESVLFGEISHSAKITYCLINDHQKVYYLGGTKNAAGLINRLRLSVMKADYSIMAHFLQEAASVSNMSDWTLAIFNDKVKESDIRNRLSEFHLAEIFAADPYQVNGRENAVLCRAVNVRRDVTVFFTTVKDPKDLVMVNHRARGILKTRLSVLEARGFDNKNHPKNDYYQNVLAALHHGFASEWVVKVISEEKMVSVSKIRHLNEQLTIHCQ